MASNRVAICNYKQKSAADSTALLLDILRQRFLREPVLLKADLPK